MHARSLTSAVIGAAAIVLPAAAARADVITYLADLTGFNESPPNASPGTGFAQVTIDTALHTMNVHVDFVGLVAGNTAAHIHSATTTPFTSTAPVATAVPTFTGFPGGATSGSYDHLFDMTQSASYNPSFVTNHGGTIASAEAFLFQSMADGKAYLNIHTSVFPSGEIRGFLVLPAPGAAALAGLAGLAGLRRRRA